MSVAHHDLSSSQTDHALLVPLGHFAVQIGLLEAFSQVPVPMKTVDHSPGEKLAQLFCHILAGGMHITELAHRPHPLVNDGAVAGAWGQEAFASASGVSALLRAATPATVAAVKAAVRTVSAPYRRRILRDLSPSWLVVDFDLTGLVVSDQAATYEGATYGYMGEVGGVGKGYQFARAQVAGKQDVLVLGGFLHPGRTVSPHCLAELVGCVEAELGRPRRRVECVEERLAAAEHTLAELDAALAMPAQESTKARQRRERQVAQHVQVTAESAELRMRRDTLVTENANNPSPRRIILRLDGGFGDADRLAWLYEQGYEFVARVHNHRLAATMRTEPGLVWEKVSKNGFIAESSRTTLGASPYPLRLFACRQWWGNDRPERWSALAVTPGLAASDWSTRRVGVFYNARQVAEASIKEGKGIFASRHLPTRHQAGIALYQELVLLAQNLLRWFHRQVLQRTLLAAAGVHELVRIGANSSAQIAAGAGGLVLAFTGTGPWSGITLSLGRQISYQLWFPFLEDAQLAFNHDTLAIRT